MTNRPTASLPIDTYYRGYRLSLLADGDVLVYSGPEHIDTFTDSDQAKAQIDIWIDFNN